MLSKETEIFEEILYSSLSRNIFRHDLDNVVRIAYIVLYIDLN